MCFPNLPQKPPFKIEAKIQRDLTPVCSTVLHLFFLLLYCFTPVLHLFAQLFKEEQGLDGRALRDVVRVGQHDQSTTQMFDRCLKHSFVQISVKIKPAGPCWSRNCLLSRVWIHDSSWKWSRHRRCARRSSNQRSRSLFSPTRRWFVKIIHLSDQLVSLAFNKHACWGCSALLSRTAWWSPCTGGPLY